MLLDAALSIIDRLIDLARGRIEGRKAVFISVLEPIFNDMVQIHLDYMKIVSKAALLVEGTQDALDALADPDRSEKMHRPRSIWERTSRARTFLTLSRTELEPIRIKSVAFVNSLQGKVLPEEEKKFIREVAMYLGLSNFPNCDLRAPRARTPASSLIEVLMEMEQSGQLREGDARDAVNLLHVRLKDAWSDLCLSFAELKIAIAEAR